MTQLKDSDRSKRPPREPGAKRTANLGVKDLEPEKTDQVKGGRRITADPDEGGE